MPSFDNASNGILIAGETQKNIPFEIQRFYFIKNIADLSAVRGNHTHHKLQQCIFCINGEFTLDLDDGENKQSVLMNKPNFGVILGPMLWHSMRDFSEGCIILVVASMHYDEKDYIRSYAEFKKLLSQN